jgi:hypothetical protein
MDYNGSGLGLGVILGELRSDNKHTIAAIDRLTEAMSDQNDILIALPDKIADRISLSMTVTQVSRTRRFLDAAKEVMPPFKEMVYALIAIAISLGLIAPEKITIHGSMPLMQLPE